MRDERFEVSVTFDAERGYIASAPELRQPIVALSLASHRSVADARGVPRRPAARWPRRARAPPSPGAGAAGALSRALGRVLIKLRLVTGT